MDFSGGSAQLLRDLEEIELRLERAHALFLARLPPDYEPGDEEPPELEMARVARGLSGVAHAWHARVDLLMERERRMMIYLGASAGAWLTVLVVVALAHLR